MSDLSWYWHRLRAMSPGEVGARLRRKACEIADAREPHVWNRVELSGPAAFPRLPDPAAAPGLLREALRRDTREILAGRWRAFGPLEIRVDDPPRWHRDYLAGISLETVQSAFDLNHRSLPEGADIKLIWELSRWSQLVRLAQAAWVLGDEAAGRKCLAWLEDWDLHNKPYRGWNWTSALESGIRLIQFIWIDALLSARTGDGEWKRALRNLRAKLLPGHVAFTWRHRSFGSSANNHLLGELAGLVLATVRWPEVARWGTSLDRLQRLWETEVLAQFAGDGGNREQALNYHLFSWELCWQTRGALRAAARKISPEVEERLGRAAGFFVSIQVEKEAWDYGDSDGAYGTPFFADEKTFAAEWREWFLAPERSRAIEYWWGGESRPVRSGPMAQPGEWLFYAESGLAVYRSSDWVLRWDLSPLGYLKTAAHGHMDALHLSLWFRGLAFVIDPGTGAYYADKRLRNYLTSGAAHNGPHPAGADFSKRLGPFLWSEHHERPVWEPLSDGHCAAELSLSCGRVRREIKRDRDRDGWVIDDSYVPRSGGGEFAVHWQFAPGSSVAMLGERKFSVSRSGVSLIIEADEGWARVDWVASPDPSGTRLEGVCSPGFRQTAFGPCLKLAAASHKPCVFRTAFLASPTS